MSITLLHFLILSIFLLVLGIFGFLRHRKNMLMLLLSLELILLGANIAFVAFSRFAHHVDGEIFALFILAVAAAETAIGLAILLVFFRRRGTISVDALKELKG